MSFNLYHKKFLEKFSSENIIALFSRYRGSSKEITESYGMYEAARKHCAFTFTDSLIVIIGDGCSPRTGAMFAYYTKAKVISIDPNFNLEHWEQHKKKQGEMGYPIERLDVVPKKIEECPIDCAGLRLITIWPHSHAKMNNLKASNYVRRCDIAMPCCEPIPNSYMNRPHLCYRDNNILSPKNIIHIWNE